MEKRLKMPKIIRTDYRAIEKFGETTGDGRGGTRMNRLGPKEL
jgi:hypothetical protein